MTNHTDHRVLPTFLFAFFFVTIASAQQPAPPANPYAPDTAEPGSVEAIAEFTTEEQFLSPWVAYVPESDTVPSPTEYLGHIVGAAGELSRTSQVYGYLRELDEASDRVQVSVIGETEEGREILLVAIADEQGLRDLPEYQAATAALADPRKTSPEQAERIIQTARPIYYFNAGLHSTETGSPEMVMEMAYRLAVSEQPMIQRIRENLVVLINPVSEPDGRDKAVDWFYRYLKGKTDIDALPPRSPPYWGHYVFHDNNRDTHQKALAITRAVHRMFYDFHPTVVHDLHESIPLLHTWNGTGPFNTNIDPILIDEWFEMAFAEIRAMTTFGMPGVWTWGFGEAWGHHYLDSVAVNHNAIGRGYETFGNATAETLDRVLRFSEEKDAADTAVTTQQWYRPLPPERNVRWSLRNNTNYMQTGSLAILDHSAKNAAEMLRGFYRKGYNSWQKGLNEEPYAFVIPADQGDPRRVAEMVRVVSEHRIEVGRAQSGFSVEEGRFPAGTYIVKLDQPYRNYAVDLLTPQEFPSETEFTPYDDVSWALPVHYGVEALAVADEDIRDVATEAVAGDYLPSAEVSGSGPVFLLKDSGQEALLAARARLGAFDLEIAEQEFSAGGEDYPAGSWILPAQDGLREELEKVASELALAFEGVRRVPDVPRHEAPLPRVAVWHTWDDTESTGWIRYTLDQQNIPYDYIRDDDIRGGDLEQYDIILFGNNGSSLQGQIHGIDKRFGPMPYTRTTEFPSHGVPDASEDITGGIGWGGMANLERYLDEGGMLITLGNGSALPLEGGLVRGVSPAGGKAVTPGSELQTRFLKPEHPVAYGYPDLTSAFRSSYTVYDIRRSDRDRIVLQWGTKPVKDDRDEDEEEESADAENDAEDEPEILVSGGIKEPDDLEGHAAILDLPAGDGRVIAYNFNPMHRDLNHSDYRFLWNAILNWQHLLERQ
ncbi:MAG: M14 family zinc carboxypeptidase [Woeseia sp.]